MRPDQVADAIGHLEASTNSQDLVDRLSGTLANYGIKGLWMTVLAPDGTKDMIHSRHSGMPKDYLQHYVERRYDHHSPIIARMRRGDRVVQWEHLVIEGSGTKALFARRIIEESRDAGMQFGISVPVHQSGDLVGWASVAFTSGSPDPETSNYVQIIALAAHQRFLRFTEPEEQSHLTRRELEVLLWASEGKTSEAIAGLLGVSTRTAESHLDNAIHKLQATNRTQAVVRAIRQGLIR